MERVSRCLAALRWSSSDLPVAYVSNNLSASISLYAVTIGGVLMLVNGTAASAAGARSPSSVMR
jgi:hypothetical protein